MLAWEKACRLSLIGWAGTEVIVWADWNVDDLFGVAVVVPEQRVFGPVDLVPAFVCW
jgi:hypothetical protein